MNWQESDNKIFKSATELHEKKNQQRYKKTIFYKAFITL